MTKIAGSSPVLERFYELVDQHPDDVALVYAPEDGAELDVTWLEFDQASTRIARMFRDDYGVDADSVVVVATRNSHWHYFATYAAWKLGALALPLRAELPARERDEILDLAKPAVVYADWVDLSHSTVSTATLGQSSSRSSERLPNTHPHPGKAIASGGSTGHSKIIVDRTWDPTVWRRTLGMEEGQVQLMAAPLYHNSPALIGNSGLMKDHTLVVMERFTPEQAVDLIERYRVSYAYLPPIIMQRIARMPGIEDRDLSSIEAFHSSAAVCPPWLKRWWIEHIGAEKVWEVYGSSEGVGATMIRGDEWLEHPGSVGRPVSAEMKILDEDQRELAAGEVGEIYMRTETGPTFNYVGAPPLKSTPDGFYSIGDLGSVDVDGYLFIADRRTDMIVTGGANVFPAEVEAALGEHPDVADAVVVGVPDDEWGRRVHAIVQPRDPANPPPVVALNAHVRERLVNYKAPKTYEFLVEFPRNEAGKIRRTQLAAERESGSPGEVHLAHYD